MSAGVVFGPMNERDIPEVFEIERASFTAPWSEAMLLAELDNPVCISTVARLDVKTIGYIFARLIIDEGHIMDVAVHPEFRGRGIGPELIKGSIGQLVTMGCRTMFLEVRSSNMTARKMYTELGFEVIGRRNGYYRMPDDDAVVMTKRCG